MQTGSSSSKYILAYDANCGPCTRFKRIVDILDKYEKIDFISLTKADQEGILGKIPVHQRYKSFHLILPKGEAKGGSEALLELIVILPGGKIISPQHRSSHRSQVLNCSSMLAKHKSGGTTRVGK